MGCQCAKSNLQDQNELVKDTNQAGNIEDNHDCQPQKNMMEVCDKKLFKTIKSGGVGGINIDEDAASNNKSSNVNVTATYNERILQLINEIRKDPGAYAKTITDSIVNIQYSNDKLIYKSKVKVTLATGQAAFEEIAEKLKHMLPMNPLRLKDDLILLHPETKEQLKDLNFFKSQVQEMQKLNPIESCFRDLVKDPETSALLMIVDDIEKNPGKKRNAILNPSYKYIGISSAYIGHSFVAYFSFSK